MEAYKLYEALLEEPLQTLSPHAVECRAWFTSERL